MSNDAARLGRISLWASIIGIVVPAILFGLVAVFASELGPAYGACELLLVLCQLVAMGCGIASRETSTGRIGLAISGTLLLVGVIMVGGLLFYFSFIFRDQ